VRPPVLLGTSGMYLFYIENFKNTNNDKNGKYLRSQMARFAVAVLLLRKQATDLVSKCYVIGTCII